MSVIYTTYDTNFKDYLKERGIRYILCGLSATRPHRMFWVYERNKQFNTILRGWIDNSQSFVM